jgi:6-phosphogluconolactonase
MKGSAPDSATPRRGAESPRPLVAVYPDPPTLELATATFMVSEARRAVKARGRFSVALAGGSTPKRLYELLAQPPFAALMPWSDVHVFWGDERCVDRTDLRSNERMARDAMLDHVPIPPDQVHPMRCAAGVHEGEWPGGPRLESLARRSADEYEELLRAFFADRDSQTKMALDLVLLGLGEDGHTASLFPGCGALCEEERWVAPVLVDAAASAGATVVGEDMWRTTLTASFINRATSVVFLVSGRAKAPMVKEVLEGPLDWSRLPAQLIRPENGTLRWHLDDDSAALLPVRSERS